MNDDIDFACEILRRVQANVKPTFTGLGLVLYEPPLQLPVASLGDQALFMPSLPVSNAQTISELLSAISHASSPWHDGFHLIDVRLRALTHVSQFLAPPVELLEHPCTGQLPVGARYLAALAGSRIESVACTALLGSRGSLEVFLAGKQIRLDTP